LEGKVDFVTVGRGGRDEDRERCAEDAKRGGEREVIVGGIVGVEEGMFCKEGEIECDQGGVDEVDDAEWSRGVTRIRQDPP